MAGNDGNSIIQVLHVDGKEDQSRSCIATSRDFARKLWQDGAFGSSTRSTRYMPDFLQEDTIKTRQKHTRSWINQQQDDLDFVQSESLQINLLEAFYLNKTKSVELDYDTNRQTSETILEEFKSRYNSSHVGFNERYASYEAFRSAGWIPKVGAQYGADFVLYEADPNTCHSRYTVVLENKPDPTPIRTILSHMRVAEQTRKKLILGDSNGDCVKLKRWGLKHEQALTSSEAETKVKQSSSKKEKAKV